MKFNRVNNLYSALSLCAVTVLLFCSRDYNPFADLTNAKVHVLAWSFTEKESVPLYSTGTLKIVVALSEEVDSFDVSAKKNRFWQDTIIRMDPNPNTANGGPYFFSVSFFDTGVQKVTVRTYRSNGEVIPEEMSVIAYSPLYQDTVTQIYGDTFSLSTPGVIDKDVQYHWLFGPGREISSLTSSKTVLFTSGQIQGTGALWITDLSNGCATPVDSFSYSFNDTSKPVIYYFNDSLNRDTLFAGDTIFVFRVHIIDNVNKTVDTCSVNGGPFDFMNARTNVYTKIIKNMSTYSRQTGPLAITVYAMDNQQFRNVARRTFYAFYDSSGEKNADARVEFTSPLGDSMSYSVPDIHVQGRVENYQTGTMILRIATNDSIAADYKVIQGPSGTWDWPVHLRTGGNKVTVTAYSTENRFMAADTAIITYDPNFIDTIKPMIWGIATDDGKSVENLFTRNGSEALEIIAFDEGSRIQTVQVNGVSASPANDDRYIWSGSTGTLLHRPEGNAVTVRAIDLAGNYRDSIFVVYKNTPPEFVQAPLVPTTFCIDTAYTLRFSYYDADNDPITLQCRHKPAGMTITTDGRCIWTPRTTDAIYDSLVIGFIDGYEQTPDTVFIFSIVDCSRVSMPVHFVTTERDFPNVLQAGVDTLLMLLDTDTIPTDYIMRFSARFTDRNQSLSNNAISPLLTWIPIEADTGFRHLLVMVGNGTLNFDTLYSSIHVVHRNEYPCSLSWRYTGSMTPRGELDLSSARKSDTLFFTINDRDDPLTESYTVTIVRHNVRSVEVVNHRDFMVAIEPDPSRVLDTLVVSIRDQTGSSDSAVIVVRYRLPTTVRRLQLNTTASGAGVIGNVLSFPVLVRLNNSNFDFSSAEGGGKDIRFRKANGIRLPYEIERWDSAAGEAEIWVRGDTIYGNDSSHYFELYQAAHPAIDSSNPAAVFDTANAFRGVWHLDEATGNVIDATVPGHDGTRNGNQQQRAGAIAMAQVYDGFGDYTDMGNVLNPGNTNFTVSAWVKRGSLNSWQTIISKSSGGNPNFNWGWLISITNLNILHCYIASGGFGWGDMGTFDMYVNTPFEDLNQWHYVTTVINRTLNANCRFYIDGAEQAVTIRGSIASVGNVTNMEPLHIGAEADYECFLNGSIDETIISHTARSADWIKLCYMNQKPQDALITFR